MKKHRIALFVALMLAAFLPPLQVSAQTPAEPPPQPAPQPASAPYSREQLAQMLAPIALYPDPLLSQILMASTYPIEVVEADRWLKRQPKRSPEALDAELLKQNWDPSVKSLCHYPKVLAEMDKNLSRTTMLGNAFLAQQGDVMAMIQDLRRQAQKTGALKDYPQQRVVVRDSAIVIEPAEPTVVYVPYYNPLVVYGSWWYPAFPPYVWFPGSYVSVGLVFGPGFFVGPAVIGWSFFNWPGRYIGVNYGLAAPFIGVGFVGPGVVVGGAWLHNPAHRLGVAYANAAIAQRFGQAAAAGAAKGFATPSRAGAAAPGAAAGRPGFTAGAAGGARPGPSLSPFAGRSSHSGTFTSSASRRGAASSGFSGGPAAGHGGGFIGGPAFGHGGGGGFGGGGHHR